MDYEMITPHQSIKIEEQAFADDQLLKVIDPSAWRVGKQQGKELKHRQLTLSWKTHPQKTTLFKAE